jgi:hypothetical protein
MEANGKKHKDYWVDCTDTLKPGKTLLIKVHTSGSGHMNVWVKISGTEYKIGSS